jgi:hypothetical protein
MVSHCSNPSCGRALTSLSEGRLFQFEIVSISVSATDEDLTEFDERPERETANFWLCGKCAESMTLSLDPTAGLRLTPLDRTPGETAPRRASVTELHDC